MQPLPDGGKLDGIIRSFRKTTNLYRILYQDGGLDDLTEEALAKMLGVEYPPSSALAEHTEAEDNKMKDVVSEENTMAPEEQTSVDVIAVESVEGKEKVFESETIINETTAEESLNSVKEEAMEHMDTVKTEES
jgi:hypothetical protein